MLKKNKTQKQQCLKQIIVMLKAKIAILKMILELIVHEPDMVYLSRRGSFVDNNFLKAQCLRSILQHVSPLAVGAFFCNSLL